MATTDFANETENCSIKKKHDREEEEEEDEEGGRGGGGGQPGKEGETKQAKEGEGSESMIYHRASMQIALDRVDEI